MVLVLLGALSIFMLPRLTTSEFDTLSFHQELKTAIRYAHKLSVASECQIQVAVTANSYALFYPDGACSLPVTFGTKPVNHPVKSGAYTGTAPTGVMLAGFGNFYFSANGAPSSSGTITLSPGTRQMVVHPLTGFVQ